MRFPVFKFLVFIMPVASLAQDDDSAIVSNEFIWNEHTAAKQAEKFNSPATWDMEVLQSEIDFLKEFPSPDYPLHMSPFPTPDYTTNGNGSKGSSLKISGKPVIGHSAIVNRGKHSEFLFKDENNRQAVYFTILSIDNGLEEPNPIVVSSRNHPNYFAQGSLNSNSENRVDWVAIQSADQNAYAVVNGKIFDLRLGRVILAAPQQDGSIRFFQTKCGPMSTADLDSYLQRLKTDKKAIEFFSKGGNI